MTSGLIDREYLVQQLPDEGQQRTETLVRAYTRAEAVRRCAEEHDIQMPTTFYVAEVGEKLDNIRQSVYAYEASPNIDVTLRYETNPTGEV